VKKYTFYCVSRRFEVIKTILKGEAVINCLSFHLLKTYSPNTDEYLKRTLNELEHVDAVVKDIIIDANDYTQYLCIEFADNGLLPCKMLVRIKPEYATRALLGASGLSLYYADGDSYSLVEQNIDIDGEGYYNFNINHNSEYWLTSGKLEKLAKSRETSEEKIVQEEKSENDIPSKNIKTGDTIAIWISVIIISVAGIVIAAKHIKK